MKKIFFALLTILIFSACSGSSGKLYTVRTYSEKSVSVKDTTLYSGAVEIFTLQSSDTVILLSKSGKQRQIEHNGKSGWVHKSYLHRVQETEITNMTQQFLVDFENNFTLGDTIRGLEIPTMAFAKFLFYLNLALLLLGFAKKRHAIIRFIFTAGMVVLSIAIAMFVFGYAFDLFYNYMQEGGFKEMITGVGYFVLCGISLIILCVNMYTQCEIYDEIAGKECNYFFGIGSYPIIGSLFLIAAMILDYGVSWCFIVFIACQVIQMFLILVNARNILVGLFLVALYFVTSIGFGLITFVYMLLLIPITFIAGLFSLAQAPTGTLYLVKESLYVGGRLVSSTKYFIRM